MDKYDKKVIMNKVISIICETIWMVLIIVGILILVSIDQTATAILLGVGLVANVIMIINECVGLRVWLDIIETKENNNTDNK